MDPRHRVADPGTVRSLLEQAGRGSPAAVNRRALDAELLLAHVLRQPRSYLLAHDDERSRGGARSRAIEALLARAPRASRWPI